MTLRYRIIGLAVLSAMLPVVVMVVMVQLNRPEMRESFQSALDGCVRDKSIQTTLDVGAQTVLWVIAFCLLFFGVLPGVLFWYAVLNSDDTSVRYRAELRGPDGTKVVIHRGPDTSKADVNAIVILLHSSAGLRKEQELGLID